MHLFKASLGLNTRLGLEEEERDGCLSGLLGMNIVLCTIKLEGTVDKGI